MEIVRKDHSANRRIAERAGPVCRRLRPEDPRGGPRARHVVAARDEGERHAGQPPPGFEPGITGLEGLHQMLSVSYQARLQPHSGLTAN